MSDFSLENLMCHQDNLETVLDNLREIAEHGLKLTSEDRFVSWLPYYNDMGLIGFILVPLSLGLDVAICWLVQRFGGRRLLGLWAVIVSLGLTALLLGSLWLLNLPLQKLPTALWERRGRA